MKLRHSKWGKTLRMLKKSRRAPGRGARVMKLVGTTRRRWVSGAPSLAQIPKGTNIVFKDLPRALREFHSPDLVREFTEHHLGKPWGLGTVTGRASSAEPNMEEVDKLPIFRPRQRL